MSDQDVILAWVPELDGALLEPWGESDFVRAYRGSGRHLADQLRWILERSAGRQEADVAGIEGLRRGLEDLERLRAQG